MERSTFTVDRRDFARKDWERSTFTVDRRGLAIVRSSPVELMLDRYRLCRELREQVDEHERERVERRVRQNVRPQRPGAPVEQRKAGADDGERHDAPWVEMRRSENDAADGS